MKASKNVRLIKKYFCHLNQKQVVTFKNENFLNCRNILNFVTIFSIYEIIVILILK